MLQSHVGIFSCLPGLNQHEAEDIKKDLVQGHNTVPPVSLELETLRSHVQHSTNELLFPRNNK